MNDSPELNRLDNLILEEKRSIAREHFSEVWDAATGEGIDADILAEELVSGVMVELARKNGSETLQKFVARLSDLEAAGAFIPDRVLQ